MRELWDGKFNWDDKLGHKQLKEWLRISGNLEAIPQYQIARCISIFNETDDKLFEYGLICFCDASAKAYATAIYLLQSLSSYYKSDLIFSKTPLAPQSITIPRLGVLIGVRALKFVLTELHLKVTHMVVFSY